MPDESVKTNRTHEAIIWGHATVGIRSKSSPNTPHAAKKITKGTALSGKSLSVANTELSGTFASPDECE
jgi:hypothetical protein